MSTQPEHEPRFGGTAAAWLGEKRAGLAAELAVASGREGRWAWARLAAFTLALVPWFVFTGERLLWAPVTSALVLVGFVLTVRRHLFELAIRDTAQRRLDTVDEALQRAGGAVVCLRDWRRPEDAPELAQLPVLLPRGEVWALTDQERDDLDLFAPPVGIFGLLNRTSTRLGALRLRDLVEQPSIDAAWIRKRQTLVRVLAEQRAARLELMAGLRMLRDEDARLARLIAALAQAPASPTGPAPTWLRAWGWLSGLLIVVLSILGFQGVGPTLAALLVLTLVNAALLARYRPAIVAFLAPWTDTAWAARAVLGAARAAGAATPEIEELADLGTACRRATVPQALPFLVRRVQYTERGGPLWLLLNLALLADVHVAAGVARATGPRRAELLTAIAALAELDALCAQAAFADEQPANCWPELATAAALEIRGGRHPLVAPERIVANDAHLATAGQRVWVITGSNMAGKSTFLRMVGVNVVLAQSGGAVSAEALTWSPLRLITDLRARDSLAAAESYFLAEVRHLRRMIHPPKGAIPLLGLIDEPFRGTNSQDQSAASVAVLEHLLASGQMFLLATHDRNLTRLADGVTVVNFHFRENLGESGMVFDYRLHAGPARTRNALRILELEGYPEPLVARAHRWLREEGLEDI